LEKSLAHQTLAHKGWAMAQAAVSRAREASLRLAQILSKNRLPGTRVWTPAVSMSGVFAVMCLAASSHAPQFITFDHGFTANQVSRAHAPGVSVAQHLVRGASTVPVVFKEASTPMANAGGGTSTAATRRRNGFTHRSHRPMPPTARVVEAMNSTATLPGFVQARETISHESVAQFQTVMFIETTQYVKPGWPVIVVWRVAWVSNVPEAGRISVANSI
jgi:hypothetical protein